jgi:hypothetical protein
MLDAAAKRVGRGGVEEVIEWTRTASQAEFLRTRGDPITVIRAGRGGKGGEPSNIERYLSNARDRAPDGPATPKARINGIRPDEAWNHTFALLVRGSWSKPAEWHPNPEIAAAIVAANTAIGGWKAIGQASNHDLGFLKRDWEQAFRGVYGGAHV